MEIKKKLTLCPYQNENNTKCLRIPRIQITDSENAIIACDTHKESQNQIFKISNYLSENDKKINEIFYCSKCCEKLKEDQIFFFCNRCNKFFCVNCENNYGHEHQLSERKFSNFWNKCIMHGKDYTKYCKTCFLSFCEDCDINSNKNHEIVNIIDIQEKNTKETDIIKNNLKIQDNCFKKVKKIINEVLGQMETELELKKTIFNNYLTNKTNGNSIVNFNEIFNEIVYPLNQSYIQKIDDLTKKNVFKEKLLALNYYNRMCSERKESDDNNNFNCDVGGQDNISRKRSNIPGQYINQQLYQTVINHNPIMRDSVDIIDVNNDGNCFYRVMSYFLHNNENQHSIIRKEIYDKASENQKNNPQKIEILENNSLSKTQYINKMKEDGFYAGDLEISIASKIFNINIATYRPASSTTLSFINYFSNDENYNRDLLILIYINNNHYKIAYYKNNDEKSQSKSNGEKKGIEKLKKEIRNKTESFKNNNNENNKLNNSSLNNLRNRVTPKNNTSSLKIDEKYQNYVFPILEKSVIYCMIRLSSGNLALGLSNGLIKIYDVDAICSINSNNYNGESEIDTLLTIDDFRGKRINYLHELKDKSLLCATYSKIHHIKLVDNDQDYEYIGTIDLTKSELPKRVIELGNEIIVSLGEKEYRNENIKRKKCLLKVFNRNFVSKSDENSFCLFSDNDSINSGNSNFEEFSKIYASNDEDSLKISNMNDKKYKNDENYKLYKNNENKDHIYICSIFPIDLNKEDNNDCLYQFIATSNRIFFNGENCVQLYGIMRNPDRHGFIFFIVKTFADISCSRMVDSICKINDKYIGIGLQKYEMNYDDGIALLNFKEQEIVKIISGLSIGLLKKSINNNNYIFFTTNKTKDLKINNELRLYHMKKEIIRNRDNIKDLSSKKDKLIFNINSGFTCLVELIPSNKNNKKNIYYIASYDKKFYVILINHYE